MSLWLIAFGLFFHSALYLLIRTFLAKWLCKLLLGVHVRFKQETKADEQFTGKIVSDGDLAEIAQLSVGIIFAVQSSVFGLLTMYQAKDDVINQESWVLIPFAHFGAWYYLIDCYTMFQSYRLRKQLQQTSVAQALRKFVVSRWSIIAHHLMLLCIGYPLAVNPQYRRGGKGDFVFGALIAEELSTPFLSILKILRLLGLKHSLIFRLTVPILLFTFFVARVANLPLVTLLYAVQHHNWDLFSALTTMTPVCHIFSGIQFLLQSYWFLSLLRIAISYQYKQNSHKKID